MISLYAFVGGLRELSGAPKLEAVRAAGLVAVIGRDVDDDALQHGLVVQELLDCADAVLPARFGERFPDVDALVAAVGEHAGELRRRLAHVEGCVELAVRVGRPAEERPRRAADGSAYMRMQLRAASADAAAGSALHELLVRCARAAVVADNGASRFVHDASYLVERGAVDAFAARVDAYATAHPELSLVCTGPWAPATFAGAA